MLRLSFVSVVIGHVRSTMLRWTLVSHVDAIVNGCAIPKFASKLVFQLPDFCGDSHVVEGIAFRMCWSGSYQIGEFSLEFFEFGLAQSSVAVSTSRNFSLVCKRTSPFLRRPG